MKQKIYLFKNTNETSKWVANYFIDRVKKNSKSVLGFATGITPVDTYKLMGKDHKDNGTDWSNITVFNLDEFIGVPKEHPESFRSQMNNNLYKYINLKKENIFLPNGLCEDVNKEANDYEKLIKNKGNIDLQYISLGANGHMAYNEPGTNLDSYTHVAKLDYFTRKVLVEQKKFPTYEKTPNSAITVGVQTIMNFKEVVMVVIGKHKAIMAKKMLEGPVTSDIPSSALQNHKNCIFIFDKDGASELDLSKFDVTKF